MSAARTRRRGNEGTSGVRGPEVRLVDAAEVEGPAQAGLLLTEHEAQELQRLQEEAEHQAATAAAANLVPPQPTLDRARQVRAAFARAGDDSDAAERLLLDLVGSETTIALQLQDVESALAVLLSRTVTDPRTALEVAKVLRETVALSNAVRRRVENSLNAAATLKAQRVLLASQRGRLGV